MKLYRFTITIQERVDDLDAVDAFYGRVNDASIAGEAGNTLIHFDRESDSLDDALRSAVTDLANEGWRVREISVEPDCVLPVSTS